MEMNKFVASCLYMDGAVFDKYCDAFGVDIDEVDVFEALEQCGKDYKQFGIIILEKMWKYVVEEYSHLLDEEKFDCDCSSPSYPDFYYDGEHVTSKEDLDAIVERELNK